MAVSRPLQIGFVSHNRLGQAEGGRSVSNPQATVRNRDTASVPRFGQLASFCTFASGIGFVCTAPQHPPSPKARPARPCREIGFVLPKPLAAPIRHNSFLSKDLPFVFALTKLALFRTLALHGPCPSDAVPPGTAPNWLCLAELPPHPVPRASSHPAPPGIGFVSHDRPRERRSPDRHTGGNWLCFFAWSCGSNSP